MLAPEDAEETNVEGVNVMLEPLPDVLLELAEEVLLNVRFAGGSSTESSRLRFLGHSLISPAGVVDEEDGVGIAEGR